MTEDIIHTRDELVKWLRKPLTNKDLATMSVIETDLFGHTLTDEERQLMQQQASVNIATLIQNMKKIPTTSA